MADRKPVSSQTLDMIRADYNAGRSLQAIATKVGVCVDTLKRIMMRENIAIFQGAKYAVSLARQARQQPTWTRPCLRCKDEKPRPRLQFLCDRCHEAADDGLPEGW